MTGRTRDELGSTWMTKNDWDDLGPLGRLGITGMTRNDLG